MVAGKQGRPAAAAAATRHRWHLPPPGHACGVPERFRCTLEHSAVAALLLLLPTAAPCCPLLQRKLADELSGGEGEAEEDVWGA
jgi:hypothetical protein